MALAQQLSPTMTSQLNGGNGQKDQNQQLTDISNRLGHLSEEQRRQKWLVDDEKDHQEELAWDLKAALAIKKTKKLVSRKMKMYHASAAWAESNKNRWEKLQLFLGVIVTIMAFVSASSVPDLMAEKSAMSGSDSTSMFCVTIGVLSIFSTIVAEKLKKEMYAIKETQFVKARVDYQAVLGMMRSQVAFPKFEAINLEAKVRRILQDLEYVYIDVVPPSHIRSTFFELELEADEEADEDPLSNSLNDNARGGGGDLQPTCQRRRF